MSDAIGHERLGHIWRSGDAYLRTLLIQGARSSVLQASRVPAQKATPEQIWINQLATRVPFGKLLVAIANKHARQLWAMLARSLRPAGLDRPSDGAAKRPVIAT